MTSPRVDFVINPISGRAGMARHVAELRAHLELAGFTTHCAYTQGPGDARRAAEKALEAGVRALVVVGGDGTIREAAGGVAARQGAGDSPPILIVPAGTENLLATHLKIPPDVRQMANLLHSGREVQFDELQIDNGSCVSTFLIVAGMGFDARVVRALSASRRGHIDYTSYFWPLWRTFWSYRHPRLTVEADGRIIHEGPGLAFVGGVPRYALGLRILDQAGAADGLLDVCVFECRHTCNLFRHALNVLLRRHPRSPGCVYTRAAKVVIWSDEPCEVQLDGDWALEISGRRACEPGRVGPAVTLNSTGRRVRFLAPAV